MTTLVNFFLRSCLGLIAVFIGYGLGSEGRAIMITGINVVLFFYYSSVFFLSIKLGSDERRPRAKQE